MLLTTETVPIRVKAGDAAFTVHVPAGSAHAGWVTDAHHATVTTAAVTPATDYQTTPDATLTASSTGVTNGVAAVLLLAGIWYAVKHKNHRWGWIITAVALGTFIGSGSIGIMLHNTVGQLLASVINMAGGVI